MSYGLQVFDASSNILLDTSDRISRILAVYTGTLYYDSSKVSWSWNITIPNFANDNTSFLLFKASDDNAQASSQNVNQCTIDYGSYYSSGFINYTITHMGY